jgi:hypothetical protein
MRRWAAGLLALAAACTGPDDPVSHAPGDPVPLPRQVRLPAPDCPILSSADWAAWVNAMPGPDARPKLIVIGRATVPTGGYRVTLEQGPLQEIHPPVQQMILRAQPPSAGATQAVVTHEVRAELPALDRYGSVTIRCGSSTLASITDVERAY